MIHWLFLNNFLLSTINQFTEDKVDWNLDIRKEIIKLELEIAKKQLELEKINMRISKNSNTDKLSNDTIIAENKLFDHSEMMHNYSYNKVILAFVSPKELDIEEIGNVTLTLEAIQNRNEKQIKEKYKKLSLDCINKNLQVQFDTLSVYQNIEIKLDGISFVTLPIQSIHQNVSEDSLFWEWDVSVAHDNAHKLNLTLTSSIDNSSNIAITKNYSVDIVTNSPIGFQLSEIVKNYSGLIPIIFGPLSLAGLLQAYRIRNKEKKIPTKTQKATIKKL